MSILFGIAHLWLFDCSLFPPPKEILGIPTAAPTEDKPSAKGPSLENDDVKHKEGCEATEATAWFQGHILTRDDAIKQYGLVGVPARSPPPIHACMVSDHDTPTYYDLYITEYSDAKHDIKMCAFNVERSGGTGDAVELCLAKEADSFVSQSLDLGDLGLEKTRLARGLKFSTTKLLSGEQAKKYLSAFAPGALKQYASAQDSLNGDDEIVVCKGAIIIK